MAAGPKWIWFRVLFVEARGGLAVSNVRARRLPSTLPLALKRRTIVYA
jgi:hypothetical protein